MRTWLTYTNTHTQHALGDMRHMHETLVTVTDKIADKMHAIICKEHSGEPENSLAPLAA
jgi:hypothetical protein